MELATLALAALIFGVGLIGGFALGVVGLYVYLFAKSMRAYTVRKKAYDKFVADLEQGLEDSKAHMASAEETFMEFTKVSPSA